MKYDNKIRLLTMMLVLLVTVIFSDYGNASSAVNLSKITLLRGQSVYVPIYSHIYYGDQEKPFDLNATLSIRNTDLKKEITLISVDYFDTDGNLLKNYVEQSVKLKGLASIRYIIKSTNKAGGSGAKFIVRWVSKEPVNPPLIEAIMISTRSRQGISFISRGQAIKE